MSCWCKPSSPLHSVATRRPTGGHMLTDAQVHALNEGGIDLPVVGGQDLLDRLQRPEHDAPTDPHQTPAPCGLDHLRVEPLRQRHPARLGPCTFGLTPRRLHPAPIVGQQRRQVLPKAISQKERRTVGRQHLRDVVDEALCHRQRAFADVDRHEQFGHRVDGHPHPVWGSATSAGWPWPH